MLGLRDPCLRTQLGRLRSRLRPGRPEGPGSWEQIRVAEWPARGLQKTVARGSGEQGR